MLKSAMEILEIGNNANVWSELCSYYNMTFKLSSAEI